MRRWRALIPGLLVLLIFLGGCMNTVPQTPDPYPYSFTDPDKPPYPRTLAGARLFISDARERWIGVPNSTVQAPEVSATTFRGDCDDFSTMLACYLQEYWGYDTFIVFLDMDPNPYIDSPMRSVSFTIRAA